jgi:hypothetical protein
MAFMDTSTMISRRQYLRAMLAVGALSPTLMSLSGCEGIIRVLGGTCPENPAESGGIDWTPDILHPVFWGFQDLSVTDGAPGPLRVFYPTYEGFTEAPPILKLCLVRWPVVLFLHGDPPCRDTTDYYRRWNMLPMVLARSGYVVIVPGYQPIFPQEQESPALTYALGVLDWVRNGWEHRRWVDPQADATAIAGHSRGALLAARVRRARPEISAFVGLSGGWGELADLLAIDPPSFFMWGTGNEALPSENLDQGGLWGHVPFGKTAAAFPGGHFDYLTPWSGCDFRRGSCTLIELVAAELSALFISRHVPVKLSHAPIPPSLEPPTVTLTQHQQFFAGGHLNGLGLIRTREGCSIDLRWNDPLDTGSRHLGP